MSFSVSRASQKTVWQSLQWKGNTQAPGKLISGSQRLAFLHLLKGQCAPGWRLRKSQKHSFRTDHPSPSSPKKWHCSTPCCQTSYIKQVPLRSMPASMPANTCLAPSPSPSPRRQWSFSLLRRTDGRVAFHGFHGRHWEGQVVSCGI